MNNWNERIIDFKLNNLNGIRITHGFNIGNSFPAHFHSTFNLGLIELGERVVHYRGERHRLKQDDIFILQPFELHSCNSPDNSVHSYKIISFEPGRKYYFPELIVNDLTLLNLIREFHTLAVHRGKLPYINKLFDQIKSVLLKYSIVDVALQQRREEKSSVDKALRFIELNCLEEIGLSDMAGSAPLSVYHFNRVFHRYLGLSPYAYYLSCKIRKSKSILIESKSATQTAYKTGFFDQSHFTRSFKTHVGVSPGKYLKENINNIINYI
jgi:AraC-like DNA-binding protein